MKLASEPSAAGERLPDDVQPALFDTTDLQQPPRLRPGDPWPDPDTPLPGDNSRCERRRPGGDPIYDLCDRVLGHTGDHAQGRFTDRPSRYITGATWADRSPQREEWDRYREQTSPLRAQRNLEADAIERAESDTDLENALRPGFAGSGRSVSATGAFLLGMIGVVETLVVSRERHLSGEEATRWWSGSSAGTAGRVRSDADSGSGDARRLRVGRPARCRQCDR